MGNDLTLKQGMFHTNVNTMIRYPYTSSELIAVATAAALAGGHELLQLHRLADSDRAHVARLLEMFDLPPGATISDLGSGIGAVARYVRELRPDVTVIQVNVNVDQIAKAEGDRVLGDFEQLPFAADSLDGAMLLYALGHGDRDVVLGECVRVLKPGGRVLLWDLIARNQAAQEGMLAALHYDTPVADQFLVTISRAGLRIRRFEVPDTLQLPLDSTVAAQAVAGCAPVLALLELAD